MVWNLPFHIEFRSTSPKGWPQLTVDCRGQDFFGRSIPKGYGTTHVPTQPGRTCKTIRLFTPKSSSKLVEMIGRVKGKVAELMDAPTFLANNDGREMTRQHSGGKVQVVFSVSQMNMEHFGYSVLS